LLTVSPHKTAADGSSYFDKDAYYSTNGKKSQWYGKGAHDLGLSGAVTKEVFDTILNGYDLNGNPLVKNAGSEDIKNADGDVIKHGRNAYIDLTFSAPKSVSLLSYTDDRIEDAHNRAVERALIELETHYSYTRKADENGDILITQSDNLVMARINHYESRELDPQLHSHIVLMNLTKGDDEKWRSIEAGKIFQDQLFIGQFYRNEIAKELRKIGYEIDVTDHEKGLFEIKGVSKEICEEFSTRRQQVLEAKEKYEDYSISEAKKSELACLDSRKTKSDSKIEEIRKDIEIRLSSYGKTLDEIKRDSLNLLSDSAPDFTPAECIRLAIDDLTDKQSAFTEKEVIERALKGGIGSYTAEQLREEFQTQSDIQILGMEGNYSSLFFTTHEIKNTEQNIIDWAQEGRNRSDSAIPREKMKQHFARIKEEGKTLTAGQRSAVEMVCTTKDRISLIQGDAGAGKSFAMGTVKETLEAEGIIVKGFAPTGKATQELEAAGVQSMTVDKFLCSQYHQNQTGKGEVWLVDEAGMMGSRKMWAFLQKAAEHNAKVVLIGDTKQFQSVEQGKIFQDLQDHSFVSKTEITEVKRQQTDHAKAVVAAIKKEDFSQAFMILEEQKGFREIKSREERFNHITAEYLKDQGNSVNSVVLTSNNTDKNEINRLIRSELARIGTVETGQQYAMFEKKELNSVSKKFASSYREGQIVVFKKDCEDVPCGSRKQGSKGVQGIIQTVDREGNRVRIEYFDKSEGCYRSADIDLKRHAAKFDTYDQAEKRFGAGDRVIFTKNDGKIGVSNGQTGTIKSIDENGTAIIQISSSKSVECNLRNKGSSGYTYLDHAYCLTNHKSQGSSYDKAIVNADVSGQRTNYNAFYVQATRMKQDLSIYTNDKQKLIDQAQIRQDKYSTLSPFKEYEEGIKQPVFISRSAQKDKPKEIIRNKSNESELSF